jgi:hypothetical protein
MSRHRSASASLIRSPANTSPEMGACARPAAPRARTSWSRSAAASSSAAMPAAESSAVCFGLPALKRWTGPAPTLRVTCPYSTATSSSGTSSFPIFRALLRESPPSTRAASMQETHGLYVRAGSGAAAAEKVRAALEGIPVYVALDEVKPIGDL